MLGLFNIDFFEITYAETSYLGFKLSDYVEIGKIVQSIELETYPFTSWSYGDYEIGVFQNLTDFNTGDMANAQYTANSIELVQNITVNANHYILIKLHTTDTTNYIRKINITLKD